MPALSRDPIQSKSSNSGLRRRNHSQLEIIDHNTRMTLILRLHGSEPVRYDPRRPAIHRYLPCLVFTRIRLICFNFVSIIIARQRTRTARTLLDVMAIVTTVDLLANLIGAGPCVPV